jgi:hypothetical protein
MRLPWAVLLQVCKFTKIVVISQGISAYFYD